MDAAGRIGNEILESADIRVNGERPWDLQVHNERFFGRVLAEGSLALGESYMDGWWDCEALDELVNRILSHDLQEKVRPSPKVFLLGVAGWAPSADSGSSIAPVTTGESAKSAVRSITLASSRTFPGKRYASSRACACSPKVFGGSP